MTGSTSKVPSAKGTSTLVRPRFGPGMLLQHDDLDLLTGYTRELSRLMFRSLFGCGVICGLEVTHEPNCGQDVIVVSAGVGLVCAGDPIQVPRSQPIVIDENCETNPNDVLWVVLCATVKCCGPRPSMCASDDDEAASACTRERDGYEIRVLPKRPKCACYCEPPEKPDPAKTAGTSAATTVTKTEEEPAAHTCACGPQDGCYEDHYEGVCDCDCEGGDGCCDCIVLARLLKATDGDVTTWTPDHSVRRFIRPVLMRDPLARRGAAKASGATSTATATASATAAKKRKGTPPQA